LFYKIIPINTGVFTVKFEYEGKSFFPNVENINVYLFLIINEAGDAVIVDAGFDSGRIPGMNSSGTGQDKSDIVDILSEYGVSPDNISTVIMTHLHWDHTSCMKLFKCADYYVQNDEIIEMMNLNPNEETYYNPEDWVSLLPRIRLVEGDLDLLPGIRLLQTGGHTRGHQAVEVQTSTGPVILAGDAVISYADLWQKIPAEYWEQYRNGEGKQFYWPEDVFEIIKSWHLEQNMPVDPSGRFRKFKQLKELSNRIYLSHDPSLADIDIIL